MKLIKPDKATKLAFTKDGFNGDAVEYTCGDWRIYKCEVHRLDLKNINVVKTNEVFWTASRERVYRKDGYTRSTSFGSSSLKKLHQQIINDALAEPEKIARYLEREKIRKQKKKG
jgi:hypothetical protein